MPLKFFDCQDGVRRPIETCIARCPRPEGRCVSLPTLVAVAQQRPWAGNPSTTQLINGTRLAYLQITEDYAVNPIGRAFALLGTQHHTRLERVTKRMNVLAEEKLGGDVTGILDLLCPDETSEQEAYELWDYKTAGSFKVAKALGLVGKKVPSPTGEIYKTSGKWGKAGDIKMVKIWVPDATAQDIWEWEYQINHYRVKIEAIGFPVSNMFVQITVRDGGTASARNRGIAAEICKVPIRRIPDNIIIDYFGQKRRQLLAALVKHRLPPMCNDAETWRGRRCNGFCDAAEFCPGRKMQIQKEDESEDGKE